MKKLLPLSILICFNFQVFSQNILPEKGTVGLSATFQGQQLGIMLPVFLDSTIVIAPTIDFIYAEKTAIDLSAGIKFRNYSGANKVRPFWGLNLGLFYNIPQGTTYNVYGQEIDKESTTDFFAGIAGGGEYFIDQNFSIGIEVQGNMTKSNENSMRFGNPGGINFNLGTMLYANIYF